MSVAESYIADVSDGLLREYLHKLGCKRTLQVFDEERPRHEKSISSRTTLRKVLGLDRLAVRLKQRPDKSLPPTLEMWVENQLEKAGESGNLSSQQAPEPVKAQHQPPPASSARKAPAMGWGAAPDEVSAIETVASPVSSSSRRSARPVSARHRSAGSPATTTLVLDDEEDSHPPPRRPAPKTGFAAMDETDATLLSDLGRSGATVPRSMQKPKAAEPQQKQEPAAASMMMMQRREPPRGSSQPRQQQQQQQRDEMLMMEDIDDLDADLGADPMPLPSRSAAGGSRRIAGGFSGASSLAPDNVRSLKELLWVPGSRGPPPSWKQGFFFSKVPGLSYGLVQKEGGPCGVLAAVQAFVMEAAYDGRRFDTAPSGSKQARLLVSALAGILWQAGSGHKVILVGCGEASTAGLSYEALGRAAVSKILTSEQQLEEAVTANLSQYMEEDGYGIVLFLFSLALTRGVDTIRLDMDVAENSLMGAHGYCTQDLVNLIISGKATSNVFDGDRQLDPQTNLKGIKKTCRVGLLTLFEWYQYVEVGIFLKSPGCPVWVVCSESHFTCLFADSPGAMESRPPFDLVFYDGLANQDAPIRLSVTKSPTGGHTAKAGDTIGDRGKTEGTLVPPLEFVIETRWPGVSVDWNGSEPIL